ncbi:transcriptional regulator, TetR family [Desulforamulus reducens MI-1]|uniref:Transcriptional regulator, TetR family n=1 Tax=Desulforamulus reducens (strain ATCC BAA-1160 / DSM 100696 / MI-1) TaxID=349161 RepID=A4J8P8_DESRM|nr:TetR/AcrR family transcriptional regulator [Desulforamulus reducens]ABO51451.1 transcriptional regulator, TetR family [Desulforamulus reducens MI-1]
MIKESKKDLIADSALICFTKSGFSGTSVDEIVKASGVSKGGIYWHFKSKEDIFLYIAERHIGEHISSFISILKEDDSPKDMLTKYMENCLATIDPNISTLFAEFFLQAKDQEIIDNLKGIFHKNMGFLYDIIRDAIDNGEFRPLDPIAVTHTYIGLINGLCHQWMHHKDKQFLELNARTALDIFIKGIENR